MLLARTKKEEPTQLMSICLCLNPVKFQRYGCNVLECTSGGDLESFVLICKHTNFVGFCESKD